MAMKEDGAVFRVDGMIVITLELGKINKKVKLGPDGSNKFRILLGRIGSTRHPGTVRDHTKSFGIVWNRSRTIFIYLLIFIETSSLLFSFASRINVIKNEILF